MTDPFKRDPNLTADVTQSEVFEWMGDNANRFVSSHDNTIDETSFSRAALRYFRLFSGFDLKDFYAWQGFGDETAPEVSSAGEGP